MNRSKHCLIMRRLALTSAAVLGLLFAIVQAQEPLHPKGIADALRGLSSPDAATFTVSCEVLKNIYFDSANGLMRIAKGPNEPGADMHVRKAIETLAAIKYQSAVPICIRRLDYVHDLGVSFGHDPVLEDRPFAQSLVDFERLGIDAVLDYLLHGNTERESEQRLALFAHVLDSAYIGLNRKGETLEDYARHYCRGRPSPSLNKVLEYAQLDRSERTRAIEQ